MKKERKDSDKNEKDNKTERRKKNFFMRRNEGIIKVSRGVNFFFLFEEYCNNIEFDIQ